MPNPPTSIVPKEASCCGVSSYQDDPKTENRTISWDGGLSPLNSEQKPEVQVQELQEKLFCHYDELL